MSVEQVFKNELTNQLNENEMPAKKKAKFNEKSHHCPYLDTINRNVLDFDFEKLCSVSLSHLNVYACLVCGKYFQGRAQNSYAYTHSVEMSHHVFINLRTLLVYCLPENYQVIDSSLDDIRKVICPTFDEETIKSLDRSTKLSRAIDGTFYVPGATGMNNIRQSCFMNVVLHALTFITPIRNFFLNSKIIDRIIERRPVGDLLSPLLKRYGELVRKVWHSSNFRGHVSPHEMLQAVVLASKKQFDMTKNGDPIKFMSWLLNSLDIGLCVNGKKSRSIIRKTFEGQMTTITRKVPLTDKIEELEMMLQKPEYKDVYSDNPFLYLTLDLPPPPLFKDEVETSIIPQVPINTLLMKFNGTDEKEYKKLNECIAKRFRLKELPPFLILCFQRFNYNYFFTETNPTIVNFPMKSLDLYDCLSAKHIDQNCQYDLIANISMNMDAGSRPKPEDMDYILQVYHKGQNKWFEIEDLSVKEVMTPMITLTTSYIQIWQRVDT